MPERTERIVVTKCGTVAHLFDYLNLFVAACDILFLFIHSVRFLEVVSLFFTSTAQRVSCIAHYSVFLLCVLVFH